jgi:hypothetical protein
MTQKGKEKKKENPTEKIHSGYFFASQVVSQLKRPFGLSCGAFIYERRKK